jgi:beta-glucanase (GH16 family)
LAIFIVLALEAEQPDRLSVSSATPIEFAGKQWTAKAGLNPVGPGPNYFSRNNILVDENNHIQLSVDRIDGRWTSAELISDSSFGYGRYSITLGNISGALSDSAVLGFFTWDESPEYFHREIDIEIRKIVINNVAYSGEFTVQPWDEPGHAHQFGLKPTSGSVYSFEWGPDRIAFEIRDSKNKVKESWVFSDRKVPIPGNEKVRINLWLVDGTPPTDSKRIEVTVKKFTFQPLDSAK